VSLVFMVAAEAWVHARHRRQIRGGVGDGLDARFFVVRDNGVTAGEEPRFSGGAW
jgi:hypothetical protein